MNPMPENYADRHGEEADEGAEGSVPGATEAATVEEPQAPLGPDFTKALRTVIGRHPVRMLTVGAANTDFPIVCLVSVNGVETPVSYNTMGDDPDLERRIENIPPIQPVAIGRVLRSTIDDSLVFDTRVFATEIDARDAPAEGFEFISTYRVLLPQINADGEQEEIEEVDEGGLRELKVGNRTLKVGDTITVARRGFGYRQAEILKFRQGPSKSHMQVFVQCQDGTAPYWALNRSIR